MRKSFLYGCAVMLLTSASGGFSQALAGPWEDGMASYNRGDYVPAIRLFRPLAQAGDPKAQGVIGAMYRKGQGVARSSAHAFMWFSMAAARGDPKAKADLHEVSKEMTPAEISQAEAMMQACEVSNYRNCEY
jgi:TPR repeat protein